MLRNAIELACEAHEGQTRKESGLPYIVHPLDVMNICLQWNHKGEHLLIVAVLHDVIEDCDAKYAKRIKDEFSERVFADVQSLTKGDNSKETLSKLRHASPTAQLVKLADIYSNTRNGLLYPKYGIKKLEQLLEMTKIEYLEERKMVMEHIKCLIT